MALSALSGSVTVVVVKHFSEPQDNTAMHRLCWLTFSPAICFTGLFRSGLGVKVNLICRGSLVGFGLLALLDSVNAAAAAPLLELPCKRTVVSRSATNMPPYSFLNDKQQLTGYRIEFMQQLFARLGCHLEILTDSPWKRALMLLESGEIDVLMNASKSAEREAYAWFSKPYEDEKVAVFVAAAQRDQLQLKQLADIAAKGYSVGIIRGNYYGPQVSALLEQPAFRKYVVEAIDKPALYQFVLRGRVQLYLDYFPNGLLALRDEKLDQQIVRYPLPPITIGQVHFMLSKKTVSEEFVRQLDLALAEMLRDGSVRKLQYKYGVMPE